MNQKKPGDCCNAPRTPRAEPRATGQTAGGAFIVPPTDVYPALPFDFLWCVELQKTATNELGFLTKRALREYIDAHAVWMAARGGEVIGYIVSPTPRHKPGCVAVRVIWQLCVRYQHRRQGVASKLLSVISTVARSEGQIGLEARCALPLDATDFWHAHSFKPIAILPANNRRKRELVCWRLPFARVPSWFLDPSVRKGPR